MNIQDPPYINIFHAYIFCAEMEGTVRENSNSGGGSTVLSGSAALIGTGAAAGTAAGRSAPSTQ